MQGVAGEPSYEVEVVVWDREAVDGEVDVGIGVGDVA